MRVKPVNRFARHTVIQLIVEGSTCKNAYDPTVPSEKGYFFLEFLLVNSGGPLLLHY